MERRAHRLMKQKELPIVSGVLVIINVIVFMICTFTGDLLYNMGELDVSSVFLQGEYLRILWAIFLHNDISHIFNNMLILFLLGAMIEKEIGHISFAVICFLSGIGGNIVSLFYKVVTGDGLASIGASGMVFGLDGLLLAMVLFYDRQLENVTPVRVLLMIAFSLYSGFAGRYVDNAAHVGGLITGFAAGTLMCAVRRMRSIK